MNTPLYLSDVCNINTHTHPDILHHPHKFHDVLDKSRQICNEDSTTLGLSVHSTFPYSALLYECMASAGRKNTHSFCLGD